MWIARHPERRVLRSNARSRRIATVQACFDYAPLRSACLHLAHIWNSCPISTAYCANIRLRVSCGQPYAPQNCPPRACGLLLIIGLAIIASVWSAEQVARAGYGPAWLQFLFAATGPTGGLRVGLVAGHRGNDSGTVCPDGLTEVEVNTRIAELTADRLRSQGMRGCAGRTGCPAVLLSRGRFRLHPHGLLPGQSERLQGCPAGRRSAASRRLAECLWDEYEAASGLPRHPTTITRDMTEYHAFRKLAPGTPRPSSSWASWARIGRSWSMSRSGWRTA